MNLKLADNLSLPIEAVTQKFAFLGRTGSGKTYGAGKLAELFLDAGAQIVVLDGIGVWYGLRLKADGKSKGYSIPVFGGEQGDVPLEPQAGRLIAKLIVEEGFSAVLDVSNFRKHERKTFVTDFAEELFHRKKTRRSALHFFCEESQMFIPERSGKDGARMLGAFEDLIKLGRNYGIGASLISQRPQAVNKEVLNQTEVLLAFQMTGIHERKAIAAWISEKGIDGEKLEDILPSLKVGFAKIWSPQWLEISEVIHIAKKKTYDASSTPEVGSAIVRPKELSPVDVAKIKESMADVVKRSEENDPKKLRAEIARLTRELASKPTAKAEPVEIEIPVFPIGAKQELKKLWYNLVARSDELEAIALRIDADGDILQATIEKYSELPSGGVNSSAKPPTRPQAIQTPAKTAVTDGRNLLSKPISRPPASLNGVSTVQQKVLDAIALCETLGTPEPPRINVAFLAGYTVNGHFNNIVGSLNTSGLITYPRGGHLGLTDAGRSLANAAGNDVQTLEDFHNLWRSKLSAPEVKILDVLLSYQKDPIGREQLAHRTGYTVNGHFNNMVGHLKTLGAAHYPYGGHVAATDVMFPEGLA